MWTMSSSTSSKVLLILLLTSQSSSSDEIVKDVSVGDGVVLQCQYSPSITTPESTLFWIRTNQAGHDNVAIGDTPFSKGYSVSHSPLEGKYDLKIEKAVYDRDNGKFECQMKQGGSGAKLHSSIVRLVVLIPPQVPSIQPRNTTFTEGEEANLTCSSRGGSPPPEIEWFHTRDKNTRKLNESLVRRSTQDGLTTSVLSFVPEKADDGSLYSCRVWNRAMKKNDFLSSVTSISVNYFPRVTIRPETTVRVEREDTAELVCKVDAKPEVKQVAWIREGRVVAHTMKHVIPRVSSVDAGLYTCQADNHLGKVVSAVADLDVQHEPEVHLPVRIEVDKGEEVVAFCNVTANPRPNSVVWSKQGDVLFVQSGPTLRLPGSSRAGVTMGKYTCTAANVVHPTGGEKRTRSGNKTIEVLVRHAPGKAVITLDTPGVEGDMVKMECGADPPGYPEPAYTWWREGRKDQVSSNKQMIIRSASSNDEGKYFCQPANKFGEGPEAEILLEIYQKPKIASSLEDQVAKAGDSRFSLMCAGLAKPKPEITWFKDGKEIDASKSNLYQVALSLHKTRNKTLRISSSLKFLGPDRDSQDQLMLSDKGRYRCQFKNQVGVINTDMTLRIEHLPMVKHNVNKVSADEGESASIKCRVQAYPNPEISWTKKDSNMRFFESKRSFGNDTYESVLRINPVDKSSYGQYICKATNRVGSKTTVLELEEKQNPLSQHWIVALLILAGLLTTAFLCFVILTCCRNSKQKNFTKKLISDPIISPTHSYDFVDSKDVNIDVNIERTVQGSQDSPEMTKSQLGYSLPPLTSEQYSFDSYTNSSTLPKNTQMQMYQYDQFSQGAQTLGRSQMPQKFNYGYDDNVFQYPHPDEYANGYRPEEYGNGYRPDDFMNGMNGHQISRFVNGDRYAPPLPNKPRQRQGVDFNFYSDDTEVQDNYSFQNISEGLGTNQEVGSHAGESIHSNGGISVTSKAGISMTSNQGVSLHNGSSFLDGVPPPEGYSTVHSTPSRKVFREVIV